MTSCAAPLFQYSWVFRASQSGDTCQRRVAGVSMSARPSRLDACRAAHGVARPHLTDALGSIGVLNPHHSGETLQARCRRAWSQTHSSTPRLYGSYCMRVRGSKKRHRSRNETHNVSVFDLVGDNRIHDGDGVSMIVRLRDACPVSWRPLVCETYRLVNELAHFL